MNLQPLNLQPSQNECSGSLSSICEEISEVQGPTRTKAVGKIYLDYLTKIVNPKDTPLKWYPRENDIKVLIVPENGEQLLVTFDLPDGSDVPVQNIITQLKKIFPNKIFHIFLVTDPVNKIRYVVKAFPEPNSNETNNNSSDIKYKHEKSSTQLVSYEAKNRHFLDASSGMNKYLNSLVDSTLEKGSMNLKRNLQILTIYPIPGKGGITIFTDDLKCLDEYEYLNDVIIDFYLKYLIMEALFGIDRNRVHLFSNFFYTRLTNPRETSIKKSDSLTLSRNQHAGVERWTQNVNIFEKDYVIIPIHQSDHWFLAIICYPNFIGVQNDDLSSSEVTNQNKCPRILIFESISEFRFKRSNVIQTLKRYVRCEYKAKFQMDCPLSENDLDAVYADVPKQDNVFDCGLYLLQYAENFLGNYVTSGEELSFPLKSLEHWFEPEIIHKKRSQLKQLIIKLALMNNSDIFKNQTMD